MHYNYVSTSKRKILPLAGIAIHIITICFIVLLALNIYSYHEMCLTSIGYWFDATVLSR